LRLSQSPSTVFRATEQRRSPAYRLITSLLLLLFIAVLPLSVVQANDNERPTPLATPAPTQPPTRPPPAATAAPVIPDTTVQVRSVAPPAPPAPPVNPTAGLTEIGEGGAAFYSPSYDNGGWDAIIRTHMRGGQGNPDTFPYSPEGYYCVHPDFVFGNILTLQNTDTGKTIRCTVADAVAPGDQGYWRNHFVIEISYSLFTALGLNNGNHVRVWALA
jgi:hypothetical protein